MEILYILNTLVLGWFLWDIHKGTLQIAAIARDISDKTDEILRRTPRQA